MQKLIENDYRHNSVFREFVKKYCKKKGIDVTEALQHEVVQRMWRQYTEV